MTQATFAAFYARHYLLILKVAQQRLNQPADAEDVASEVFQRAWAHHDGGGDLNLRWVYVTLRNVVGNEYRRRDRAAVPVAEIVGGHADSARGAPEPDTDDAVDIRRGLATLSDSDREVLYMAYWEDLSGTEIAEILGCSRTAVTTRLMRAKSRLRKVLTAQAARPVRPARPRTTTMRRGGPWGSSNATSAPPDQ
ncbi:RNA polymerase sigma factor [Salana multivorans]